MFLLFSVIASIVLSVVDGVIGTAPVLGALYSLGVLLPSLAVSVRLHDTDRSGWWLLLLLIPLVDRSRC